MIVSRASLLWLLAVLWTAAAADGPLVRTPLGEVRGARKQTPSGREYLAFTGLPYAKPPVGQLRFQLPQPLEPWTQTREATARDVNCLKVEDCLYLNVFAHNDSRNAPVLVVFQTPGMKASIPTGFMEEDVIVVNVNYRMGILGFLSFESPELPGNLGLKDQAMALRWVQENIASFGGDPGQVTITGIDMGAACVYHHFISPLSKGLFHRGIAPSGSSYNPWALAPPGLARSQAVKLMQMLGCPTDPKQALPCIMEKEASDILRHLHHFVPFLIFEQMLIFPPVLEEAGPNAFIPAPVSKWEHKPLPLLVVLTSAEGLTKTLQTIKGLSTSFDKAVPVVMNYLWSATHLDAVTKKIKEFYLPDTKEMESRHLLNITNMYTDGLFAHGIIEGANKHKGNLYFLYFDYTGPCNEDKLKEFCNMGAPHNAENFFTWGTDIGTPSYTELGSDEAKKLSRDLIKMIVNYTKTGTPNIPGSDSEWKTWTKEHNNYVHMERSGSHLKEGLLKERFEFWNTLNYKDKFD